MSSGPFNTFVLVSGASATFTAAIFCALYVAFRIGLARQPRESATSENESEFRAPYFGRVN